MMNRVLVILFSCTLLCCSEEKLNNEDGTGTQVHDQSNSGYNSDNLKTKVKPTALYPQDYVAWIRDSENGLKRVKKIGDFTFTLLYKPKEYMACMEYQPHELDEHNLKSATESYSELEHFELRIEIDKSHGEVLKYGVNNREEYQDRITYYAFKANQDAKLILKNNEHQKELDCVVHHWERTYDAGPVNIIQFAFKKDDSSEQDKVFVFDDKIFNTGRLKFKLRKEDLMNLPEIKV